VVGGDFFDSFDFTQDRFAQYKSAQNDRVIFWFSVSDLVVNRGRKGGFELTAMRQLAINHSRQPNKNQERSKYEGEIKYGGFVFSDCIGRLHDDAGKA
jgi:hypothetical protein